jgi:hypothetical protein
MTFHVLDPTNESAPPLGQLAPRPGTLRGKTVGLISNGKEGTKGFFTHLDRLLRDEFGVANVVFRTKSNYSAPPTAISWAKLPTGTWSSPASATEAVVRRAVCMTPSQPNAWASPPSR